MNDWPASESGAEMHQKDCHPGPKMEKDVVARKKTGPLTELGTGSHDKRKVQNRGAENGPHNGQVLVQRTWPRLTGSLMK